MSDLNQDQINAIVASIGQQGGKIPAGQHMWTDPATHITYTVTVDDKGQITSREPFSAQAPKVGKTQAQIDQDEANKNAAAQAKLNAPARTQAQIDADEANKAALAYQTLHKPGATQAEIDQSKADISANLEARTARLNDPEFIAHLKAQDASYLVTASKVADDIKNADFLAEAKRSQLLAAVDNAATKANIAPSIINRNNSSAAYNDARTQAIKQAAWTAVQGELDAIDQQYLHDQMTTQQRDQAKQAVIQTAINRTIDDMNGYQRATVNQSAFATEALQRGQDVTSATAQRDADSALYGQTLGNVMKDYIPPGALADQTEFLKQVAAPASAPYTPTITGSAQNTLYNPAQVAQSYAAAGPGPAQLPPQIQPPPGTLTGAQHAANAAASFGQVAAPVAGVAPTPAPVPAPAR